MKDKEEIAYQLKYYKAATMISYDPDLDTRRIVSDVAEAESKCTDIVRRTIN
jgi:hypothetical protein